MILMRVSEEFLQLREATCGYLLCFSSKVVQKISHWARVLCSLLNHSQGTKDQFLVLQASLFFLAKYFPPVLLIIQTANRIEYCAFANAVAYLLWRKADTA